MSGPPTGARLNLTDHFGQQVMLGSFAGRFVLLFFGFTHCRVVCPAVLGLLSRALDRIGALNKHVQPIYVTVDPERDTPDVMRHFLEASYPRFLGLTGSKEQIQAAKADYKVWAEKKLIEGNPSGYDVPHTAFVYILDPHGRYLTHLTNTATEDEVISRLETIVGRET